VPFGKFIHLYFYTILGVKVVDRFIQFNKNYIILAWQTVFIY